MVCWSQEEYEREQITWSFIEFPDNQVGSAIAASVGYRPKRVWWVHVDRVAKIEVWCDMGVMVIHTRLFPKGMPGTDGEQDGGYLGPVGRAVCGTKGY